LWIATSRQAELTKDSVRISERALLDLERAGVVPGFPNPVKACESEWEVLITVQNVGRSYAIFKGIFARIADSVETLPSGPNFETGYAHALRNKIFGVGRRGHIFHLLPEIRFWPTWDDAKGTICWRPRK
jgi:hypothetical protein